MFRSGLPVMVRSWSCMASRSVWTRARTKSHPLGSALELATCLCSAFWPPISGSYATVEVKARLSKSHIACLLLYGSCGGPAILAPSVVCGLLLEHLLVVEYGRQRPPPGIEPECAPITRWSSRSRLFRLVLEGQLDLGSVEQVPSVTNDDVLTGHLGHSDIKHRSPRRGDRLCRRLLPRGRTRPNHIDYPVHAHGNLSFAFGGPFNGVRSFWICRWLFKTCLS